VMDIVRRYGRPQSSTSELLASLVEMGLLYKDARSRSFLPTPRLASLGRSGLPASLRNGRLFAFMDRLAYQTRLAVALVGVVGTHAQIFRWSPGSDSSTRDLGCGAATALSDSVAGLLLLAAMQPDYARRILWRLHAEGPEHERFLPAEVQEQVRQFRRQGHATGSSGFAGGMRMTAMLLPIAEGDRPLAVGLLYPEFCSIDPDALVATLERGIAQCHEQDDAGIPYLATGPFVMAG
jgi:DNA-binding IclR family transcriptional regulator